MRRFFTLFILLIFSGMLALAQNRVITGTVKDGQGNPVGFATVTEKGTTNVVTTDAIGSFSLKTKNTASTLVVSVVGYDKQEVAASGNSVAIVLARNTQELTAVVVTALGQVRQSKELGYATAKLKAPEVTQAKAVNIANGLTGKVSGLNIQTVNNGVFANVRILLRGIRSLTGNNQPMLIVDGVPIDLNLLSTLNPNDITDVSILKSASATAIYGPEGVNGAVVVTTRRGSTRNPVFTVSHTAQLEKVTFMPKLQSQFGSGSSETASYEGIYDPIENQGYGPKFGDMNLVNVDPEHFRIQDGQLYSMIGRDGPGGEQEWVPYKAQPQEKKNFWNTGITNQTDLSVATGDFYLSFQNVDIKGIMPKDHNKRVSAHMSAVKDLGAKLKSSFNIQYTRQTYNVNAGASFGNGRDYSPYWNLINTPMEIPTTKYKNWRSDYFSSPDGYFNDYYYNPYWMIDNFRADGRTDNLLGDIQLDYKLTPSINITYRIGGTLQSAASKTTQEGYTFSEFAKASGKSSAQSGDIVPGVFDNESYATRINSELFANYRKQFGKFKVDVILGHNFRETQGKSIGINNDQLGIPGVYNTGVRSGSDDPSESIYKTRYQRLFGKLGLSYNSWAYLEFNASDDWDSRLVNPYDLNTPDFNYFYPGVSGSLVLSDAIAALKNSHLLSFLKVRGAITKTGNTSIGPYQLENTYYQGNGFPYGNLIGFTANNTLHQTSYKPEFVKNREIGIELGFLKNRINFEATAYSQKNTNQLITVQYSASTGYPSALLNAADFDNKGVELDLKLTPLIKIGKLSIDYKINYSHQTNKVNALINGVPELGVGNGNYLIVGEPAYTFKLTDYVRVDDPTDPNYGKVIVDATTGYPTVSSTTKKFGRTLPTDLLGMTLNVNFKGFALSAVADYRGGNQIYSGIGGDMDFSGISFRSGQNGRQPFVFPNSVVETAPGTKVYVDNTSVYTTDGGYNFWSQTRNTSAQSNYLCSGAFWKLREVALTYTFPTDLLPKKIFKGASISISGRNLVTLLPKTNEWTDPEFSNTTGNAQGVNDRNNTPPTRIFGANLTLQF